MKNVRNGAYQVRQAKVAKVARYKDMISHTPTQEELKTFHTLPYYMQIKEKEKSSMRSTITLEPLEFITKSGRHSSGERSKCDVGISILTDSHYKGKKRVNFTFRNDCYKAISDTGYVKLAVKKNRVFFAPATQCEGYKFAISSQQGPNRYIKLLEESLESFAGQYDLKYDDFYELYYIEKEQ